MATIGDDGSSTAPLTLANFLLTGRYSNDDVSLNLANLLANYATKNAGSNIIVSAQQLGLQGAKAGNYVVNSSASAAIGQIARAVLNVIALPASKVYGDQDTALAYSYSGLVGGEGSANFSGTVLRQHGENVGQYQISRGTLAATGNYVIGSFTPANYSINKAPLLVRIHNASMLMGGEFPSFAADYLGLKLNDDTSAISGLTLYSDATLGSPIGTYSIYGKNAAAQNYSIQYQSGVFYIHPASALLPTTVEQSRILQNVSRTERAIAAPTLLISTPVPPTPVAAPAAPQQSASTQGGNTNSRSSSSTANSSNTQTNERSDSNDTQDDQSYHYGNQQRQSGQSQNTVDSLVYITDALKRTLAIN